MLGKLSKGTKAFSRGLADERIPKMVGLLLILIAFYLFIAFTSFLFTWKADSNLVDINEWGLLADIDHEAKNSLGRLGALLSHTFFKGLFGLPSYFFVYLLAFTGYNLIMGKSFFKLLVERYTTYIYTIAIMLWLAIFFEFTIHSGFFWGGAFGEAISSWLVSLIGIIGTFFFLFFIIIAVTVWRINPNFKEWTKEKILYDIKVFLENSLPKKYHKHLAFIKPNYIPPTKPKVKPKKTSKPKVIEQPKTLRPSSEPKPQPDEKGQLTLQIDKTKREKPQAIKKGEGELEIIRPKAGDNIPPIEAEKLAVTSENKTHVEPYDPTLDLASYEHPILQLLESYDDQNVEIDHTELENNKDQIIETLLNYKIEITKIKATIGPTVTLYEIVPAPGVRISRIKNLEDDIALSLAALGIRIIAPIPGRGTIGIEVPNKHTRMVSLKEVLASEKFKRAKMDLPIALGKTISNEVLVADLAKMPHLLIAGATGQGKSVGINTVLMSLLYKKHPSQVKLVLVDPKKVELSLYSKIENHFLGVLPGEDEPIVTETSKVINTISSLCIEMDQRYDLLKKAHVRNLKEYNQKFVQRRLNPEKGHRFLPYIVLVIDEFADLIMTAGKEIELPIGRLAQLARAVGIHLIIATQRPSVNIITGVIKANFPARIAYKVASKIDSRTILDSGGAEQLIGKGDMLLSVGGQTIRLQCAFVDTHEVDKVIDFIHSQRGYPEPFLLPDFGGGDEDGGNNEIKFSDFDENFEDAARLVVQNQSGSTSMIQRRMKLGYNRAGRIMDQMESVGIVGPSESSKPREVLIFSEAELERFLEHLKSLK